MTSVINFSIDNTVHLLSISGRVGVHAKGTRVALGLVSRESYPTTRCDWGMPFFSALLKCAAYSDSGYCGAHKCLSEEKGMEKERVGSRFKRKPPIRTPILLSNLSRHKKSNSLIPKDILREQKRVFGRHSLCQSQFSCTAQHSSLGSTLLLPWSAVSAAELYLNCFLSPRGPLPGKF